MLSIFSQKLDAAIWRSMTRVSWKLLIATCLCQVTAATSAQEQSLQWELNVGEQLNFDIRQENSQTIASVGSDLNSSVDMSFDVSWKVLELKNLEYVVEQTVNSVVFDSAYGENESSHAETDSSLNQGNVPESILQSIGAFEESIGKIKVTRYGKVEFVSQVPKAEKNRFGHQQVAELISGNLIRSPIDDVYVGKEWSQKSSDATGTNSGDTPKFTLECVCKEINLEADHKFALIEFEPKFDNDLVRETFQQGSENVAVTILKADGSGSLTFSLEEKIPTSLERLVEVNVRITTDKVFERSFSTKTNIKIKRED